MINDDRKIYNISSVLAYIIFLSPFLLLFFTCLFLQVSLTRSTTVSIIVDNQLVMRSITSIFLIASGFLGLRLILRMRKYKEDSGVVLFYLILSLVFILIGMEKIMWGQLYFQSNDLTNSSNLNLDSETIFHSIKFWRRHLEIFPMTFGLAGLFGIWISKRKKINKISPSFILWPWFIIIAVISAIDLSFDFYKNFPALKIAIDELEEVIEMMVGISAFLYILLNSRRYYFNNRNISD